MKLRTDLDQGTAAWLQWRAERLEDGGPRIMASDVPTIMGVSPYETPHQLWLRMTGRVGPKASNFAMQRGHRFEPVARAKIEESLGSKIWPVCCEAQFLDPAPIWAACSLDGRHPETGQIFEIKVPGKASFEEVASGICPAKWYPQLHWQMLVTDTKSASLAVYDPGDGVISDTPRLASMLVERDDAYMVDMLEKVTRFREAVMRDEPLAGDRLTAVAVRWFKAYKIVEDAKESLEVLQKELIEAAKSEGKTETPVASISYSTRKGAVDYPKLLADLGFPDIPEEKIDQFRKPASQVESVRKAVGAEAFLMEWEMSLRRQGESSPVGHTDDPSCASPALAVGSMAW